MMGEGELKKNKWVGLMKNDRISTYKEKEDLQ